MNVHVLAGFDGRDDLADVAVVFDDGVARLEILQGDLVAKGNIHQRLGGQFFVGCQIAALERLPRLDIDDGDADRILLVVDKKLNHTELLSDLRVWSPGKTIGAGRIIAYYR